MKLTRGAYIQIYTYLCKYIYKAHTGSLYPRHTQLVPEHMRLEMVTAMQHEIQIAHTHIYIHNSFQETIARGLFSFETLKRDLAR